MGAIALLLMAASWTAVVTRPVANLYSQPAAEADVVSQALLGVEVAVIEERDGFANIRMADQYTGWIERSALAEARPLEGRPARVSSLFANLYREKSITKREPLLAVPFDARLEAIGDLEDARWFRLRLPDGREAWVQRGDVTFEQAALGTAETIGLSRRFLGLPYLWGGTSTFGYDCSGFTQMLVAQRGIVMPRDAHLQAAWSGVEPIEREDLEPGDLLFFGASEERITHTGMYLGSGEFIHATAHERPAVQVSRLDDPHWTKLLVCSRRVKVGAPAPAGQ